MCTQVQSFVSHVRFTEATAAIPKDVLLLEVGPHALLRAPLRQNLPTHQYVVLLSPREIAPGLLLSACSLLLPTVELEYGGPPLMLHL